MLRITQLLVVFCCFIFCGSVNAAPHKGPAKLHTVKNAVLLKVKDALLHRVDGGVFQLQAGKSMDLTENKVLLTFRNIYSTGKRYGYGSKNDRKIVISLNGDTELIVPGNRINLLKHKDSAGSLEGYSQCFLDYVGLIMPKGAPAKATFRLHCE